MFAPFSIVSRDKLRRVRVVMPVRAIDLPCLPYEWNKSVRGYHQRGRGK
jgi:hypothetical protein